jgi:hypothetical protein
MGVISLGRVSCTCHKNYYFGTSEELWVKAAINANIALPADPSRRGLHTILGSRLAAFDRNNTIELILTDVSEVAVTGFDGCSLPREELGHEIRQALWALCSGSEPTNVLMQKVRINQRTPLRLITRPFIQHLQQLHKNYEEAENGDLRGYHERDYKVSQGTQSNGGYFNAEQEVRTNFSAWHWQLADGDVLSFTEREMLAD